MATRISNAHKPRKFELEWQKTLQLLEDGDRDYLVLPMETPIAFLNHLGTGGGGKFGLISGIAQCITMLTTRIGDNPLLATPRIDYEGPVHLTIEGRGSQETLLKKAFAKREHEQQAKLDAHKARNNQILGPVPVLGFKTEPAIIDGIHRMNRRKDGTRVYGKLLKPKHKSQHHRYVVPGVTNLKALRKMRLTRHIRGKMAWTVFLGERHDRVPATALTAWLRPLIHVGYDGRDQHYLWWDYLENAAPKIQQALDPLWLDYRYLAYDQYNREVRAGAIVADPETGAVHQAARGETGDFLKAVGDGQNGWDTIPAPVFMGMVRMVAPKCINAALTDTGMRTYGVFRTRWLAEMMHASILEAASTPDGFAKVGTSALMLAGETLNGRIEASGAKDYVGSLVKFREWDREVQHMA